MQEQYQELKRRLLEVNDLQSANSLLGWDQATYMPAKGTAARGRQIATLSRLAQEKFTDPEIGRLLDELEKHDLPYDSDEASLIRVTRRSYERAIKVPPEFTAKFAAHSTEAYSIWAKARPENDFATVQPYLEKTLDLSIEFANFFPDYDHIADPLIDGSDYGMKAESIRQIFSDLREQLVPIAQSITEQAAADDSSLRKFYPVDKQQEFGEYVIQQFGYDFARGRQDKTHHPFMTKFSLNDVRITTRFQENFLGESLGSTMHEAGHALYELGINQDYEGTPLARGASAGVHESQSRLWENVIGRSRPFWEHFYPLLQETFPQQLNDVDLDTFHRAFNKVENSLIRTDADEVTYNLHVMIRFDLELQMLEGELAIKDLPDAWHARYDSDLGTHAPSDVDGVLQDVHWYAGFIGGAFQGYTLGNIISGQFYEAALKAHPSIPTDISRGEFGTLHNWLKDNIYQHGRKYTPDELIERVTGKPLTIEPYINYLRTKYGELYKV